MIQCTDVEIAHCLGVSEATLIRRKHDDAEFAETLDRARSNGRMSLRRKQWEAASAGNPTMLIWLGKQILGQRDRFEHSGDAENPVIQLHWVAAQAMGQQLLAERTNTPLMEAIEAGAERPTGRAGPPQLTKAA